jgi:hypothetical protein
VVLKKPRSNDTAYALGGFQQGEAMIGDATIDLDTIEDDAKRAHKLRKQIHKECRHSLHLGQAMHWLYLSLIGLTVGSSAAASIMALTAYDKTGRLVGVIALIPGICAGVSERFRLRLKKHWYYRRYDQLNALVRRMDFVLPPEPNRAQIAKLAEDFCKIDAVMSRGWERLEQDQPDKPDEPDGKTEEPQTAGSGSQAMPSPSTAEG